MQRNKLIVGNWKMHKTPSEGQKDFLAFAEAVKASSNEIQLGIAAPFLSLPLLAEARRNEVEVYAQNCHWEKEGAFTGEISAGMLKSIGVQGSLVAHSERRQMNGETNLTAGKRIAALLAQNLRCIYCVGETLQERESGRLFEVLKAQIREAFEAGSIRYAGDAIGSNPSRPLLSIAYEPVWAIGTGKSASPQDAQEAHAFLRKLLAEELGSTAASQLQILYGGSVKPENIQGYLGLPDVDGALVGGASLKPQAFVELVQKALA